MGHKKVNINGSIYLDSFISTTESGSTDSGNELINAESIYGNIMHTAISNKDFYYLNNDDDKTCSIEGIKSESINEIINSDNNYPIAIPAVSPDKKIVTAIKGNAFSDIDKTNEFRLVLPNTIYKLEENAFLNLTNLKVLYINNPNFSIGQNALSGCSSLISISGTGRISLIDVNGLSNTASLYSLGADILDTENGVTFSDYSLDGSGIVEIEVPNNSIIGKGVFSNCLSLEKIHFGKNINSSDVLMTVSSDAAYSLGCVAVPKDFRLSKSNNVNPVFPVSTIIISTDELQHSEYDTKESISMAEYVSHWNSINTDKELRYIQIDSLYMDSDYQSLFAYLEDKNYITPSNLTTKLASYVTNSALASKGYVTNTNLNTQLSSYYTKTQIDNMMPDGIMNVNFTDMINRLYYGKWAHEIKNVVDNGAIEYSYRDLDGNDSSVYGYKLYHDKYNDKLYAVIPPFRNKHVLLYIDYSKNLYNSSTANFPPEHNKLFTEYKFYNKPNIIHKLYIPSSVRAISEWMFYEASVDQYCLTEGLESIAYRAFASNKISMLELPESVKILHAYSLAYSNIGNISINSDAYSQLAFYNSYINNLIIKNKTSIDYKMFSYAQFLNKLILPDSVKKIGCNAFQYANIPDIDLGWVEKIMDSAFYGVRGLHYVEIPDTCTYLGSYAFYGSYVLERVIIGNGIKTIESNTFSSCRNLKYVYVPKSVTSIASDAFYYMDMTTYKYMCKCGYNNSTTQYSNGKPNYCYKCGTALEEYDLSRNLTIICEEGSYADMWVTLHNTKCELNSLENQKIKKMYTSELGGGL